MVHEHAIAFLKSNLEVSYGDDGKDRIWGELVLDDTPLLLEPVLIKQTFDELRRVYLAGQTLEHRAEGYEVLSVTIQPFEIKDADIYRSCGFMLVFLKHLLELLLLDRAFGALHRKDLAVARPIEQKNLPSAFCLEEAIVQLLNGRRCIVLDERSKVILTR